VSLLPPDNDPSPAEILRDNLTPSDAPPPRKRGRPAGSRNATPADVPTFDFKAALDGIHTRLDDLLVRVNAICNQPTPDSSPALDRIAVALEAIAGGRIVLAHTAAAPPSAPQVQTEAPAPVVTQPVKTPAPVEAPAAPLPDTRAAAVAFVEKWGRDVLVGILAKHSPSGKLSDLRDPAAFLAALADYERKAEA
jgi:hypothetical protein